MTLSGRTTLHLHKGEDWQSRPVPENAKQGVRKVWLLDAQWSTCPVEVEDQVRDLWRLHELRNDVCVLNTSIADLIEQEQDETPVERWDNAAIRWVKGPIKTNLVVDYLRQHGIGDGDQVLIHWWW